MSNHPNRNWRARMQTACDAFLARWPWRDGSAAVMTADQVRQLMHTSYVAGYTDRHQRDHATKT